MRVSLDEHIQRLEQLPTDALAAVWSLLDPDDAFAASLACRKLNAARDGAPIRTRICSSLRSVSLRQWAEALGCPSPYPHWVKLHGLQAAALYNGRVGLAMKPPNESGRIPIEVDGGLGECATGLQHAVRILVKPVNIRPLTQLGSELVLAVRLLTSRGGRQMRHAVLPREHSCFLREAALPPTNPLLSFEVNLRNSQLSTNSGMENRGMTFADMDFMVEEEEREKLQPLIMWSQPLPSARWANVERPELMTMLGVPLAVQRLEAPSSRGRLEMQNQQATLLMIDPETGMAHPHWQDGVGEVLVYRCPTPSTSAVTVGHLTVFDMDIVSSFIDDELQCGEALSENPIRASNLNEYRQHWKGYEERCVCRKLEVARKLAKVKQLSRVDRNT